MTPEERKIDEIMSAFDTDDFFAGRSSIETAKDQIYKAVMEIIGEDDIYEMDKNRPTNEPDVMYKNELRQTQRQRANKFFGRDK